MFWNSRKGKGEIKMEQMKNIRFLFQICNIHPSNENPSLAYLQTSINYVNFTNVQPSLKELIVPISFSVWTAHLH